MVPKITTVILLLLPIMVELKVYNNCELGRELLSRWPDFFNKNNIHTWVCIAKYESSFNTKAVGPPNWDGSQDYGLFQINNRYWCGPGKGCNVSCEELLSDDIQKVVMCARKVATDQGLSAWTVYKTTCQDAAKARATTQGCGL